tara:strand:- start:578 stop:2116 length:1539 start_codon:yes stop_codon:yes gene_type:complete
MVKSESEDSESEVSFNSNSDSGSEDSLSDEESVEEVKKEKKEASPKITENSSSTSTALGSSSKSLPRKIKRKIVDDSDSDDLFEDSAATKKKSSPKTVPVKKASKKSPTLANTNNSTKDSKTKKVSPKATISGASKRSPANAKVKVKVVGAETATTTATATMTKTTTLKASNNTTNKKSPNQGKSIKKASPTSSKTKAAITTAATTTTVKKPFQSSTLVTSSSSSSSSTSASASTFIMKNNLNTKNNMELVGSKLLDNSSSSSTDQLPDITNGGPISTDKAAKKLITSYMLQQNRPYSVIQICDNLHKRIQKSACQRVMDELVAGGILRCKQYGAASIYFPDQAKLCKTKTEVLEVEEALDNLSKEAKSLAEEESVIARSCLKLMNEPTDSELIPAVEALRKSVVEKETRLKALGTINIGPEALNDAINKHNYYLKEWKDRRNKALGFAADVADGMDKKKSMVVEMFGLETDEEVGIMKIPDMISIPSNGGSGSSSSSYNGGRKPLAILARR